MSLTQRNAIFRSTNLINIVSGVLAKLGRVPVTNIQDSNDAIIIAHQMPLFLGELLLKAPWTFATKYYFTNTPITVNLEQNPLISFQYQNNFALPYDYGRFWRFVGLNSPTFGLDYQIIDNVFQCNTSFLAMYYTVNFCEYSAITNQAFLAALIHYAASQVALSLTNRMDLKQEQEAEYLTKIGDAISQNAYEQELVQTAYNDFSRRTYI